MNQAKLDKGIAASDTAQMGKLLKKPKPICIGVTGGTASGKTSLCDRIAEAFTDKIALLALDMFYRGLS